MHQVHQKRVNVDGLLLNLYRALTAYQRNMELGVTMVTRAGDSYSGWLYNIIFRLSIVGNH